MHSEYPPISNPLKPDETGKQQFYRALGNWSELGCWFSGGMGLSFLARLIPGILVAYAIGVTIGAIALAFLLARADGETLTVTGLVAIALASATIAGHWDVIAAIALAFPGRSAIAGLVLFCIALGGARWKG